VATQQLRRLPPPEEVDIRAMIDQYIEQSPYELGRENARLKGRRISVPTLVTALLYQGGDLYAVAEEYEIPVEAVRAAIWYYGQNKLVVDARLLLNWAIDEPDNDLCASEP